MNIVLLKKFLSTSLILTIMMYFGYSLIEPQIAAALVSTSDVVIVTLNVDAGISITSPADSTMLPNIGVSQNTSVATTTWNVKTNSANGYFLNLKASTAPALQQTSTTTVADYGTATSTLWSVSNAAKFGYSAFGTDTATGYWGTGSACNVGAQGTISTTLKYLGFTTSTSTTNVANRTATTTTAGVDTTVCYAAEQNTFYIPSGTYPATITARAVSN